MKLFCILIAGLLLAGCATGPATSTGRPEVRIAAPPEKIRARLTNVMLDQGFQPRSSDPMNLVFEKASDSVLASLALGSTYDTTVNNRARFTIVDAGEGISRVVASFAFVGNPGSGFERSTDVSDGKAGRQVQGILEQIKAELESGGK